MPSRRKSIALTLEERQQFIADGWMLQVASLGPKGFPHLVAMWYVVIDGDIHFTTFAKSQKILNLRRNPKISVMIESGKPYNELKGVVIEGNAEVIDDPMYAARVMAMVAHKYSGAPLMEEPPPQMVAMASKRVTVRVRPVDIYSWDHSKLGGRY